MGVVDERTHLTINASGPVRKCLGLHFELRASGQLEPPRLTVYKGTERTMPGAISNLGSLSASHADFGVSSNGLQNIDFKAEVVELADTPSDTITLTILYKLLIL